VEQKNVTELHCDLSSTGSSSTASEFQPACKRTTPISTCQSAYVCMALPFYWHLHLQVGLQGVDNGAMRFTNVRIPRDNLLDRFATVDRGGKYSSPYSPSRRFAATLGELTGGRVGLTCGSLGVLKVRCRLACVPLGHSVKALHNRLSRLSEQLLQMSLRGLLSQLPCLLPAQRSAANTLLTAFP